MPLTASVLTIDILTGIVQQMAERCGYPDESAEVLMLLLTEEVGELARAIRLDAGISASPDTSSAKVPDEVADVTILALRIARLYGLDLGREVLRKAEANERRMPKPPSD